MALAALVAGCGGSKPTVEDAKPFADDFVHRLVVVGTWDAINAEVGPDVTQVVVSIGGNDALLNSDLLNAPVGSTAEALALFGRRVDAFNASYVAALESVLALGLPTTVCTIYEGNLEPAWAPLARVALMVFNDVILRVAFERAIDVIDLRLVCTEVSDYANPIEPSGSGGKKIAAAIVAAAGIGDGRSVSRVFGQP